MHLHASIAPDWLWTVFDCLLLRGWTSHHIGYSCTKRFRAQTKDLENKKGWLSITIFLTPHKMKTQNYAMRVLPMHTQQNSYLHFRQVMWLHPPFFSIVEWHFGHSLVCADIQFAVSESSSHFFCHFLTSGHIAG
jgi:hypothetical protein